MNRQIITIGALGENCYCLAGETGAVVIDPGAPREEIRAFCRAHARKEKAILLTHGHFDHIGGVADLLASFDWPVYIGEGEAPFLNDPAVNLSARFGQTIPVLPVHGLLRDGETLNIGDVRVRVIHTPGHTAGSVCFLIDGALYAGDTLFASSFGRTDFPGGDETALRRSLDRLMELPADTVVFPGHMGQTTIGREQAQNPYRGYLA